MIEKILCFLVLIICLVYGLALLSWLVMKLDIEKRRSKRTKFFERMGENLLEIEKLKDMLRNAAGGPVGIQMCQEAADALEQLQAENDRLRRERDAAVSDLETIMAYGGGNLDTCQFCKNSQCYARGGTKLCIPEWRG